MRNKGFTLIELMIVVAIILIIAAIAVPNLLQSRIRANEADVIAQLRNYVTAQEKFRDEGASGLPVNNAGAAGRPGWFADNYRNLYYGGAVLPENAAPGAKAGNIRLVNKAYADAFRTDGMRGATPTAAGGADGAEEAPAEAAPFSGYYFTEPRDVPEGFFEQHFAQIAVPGDSSRTGNHAFFVDDNGAIRAFRLPPGLNAEAAMALVADKTPLTNPADWETIR